LHDGTHNARTGRQRTHSLYLSLPAMIDCGASPVQVIEPGGEIGCDVSFADGSKQSLRLRVMDVEGTVSIEPTA
jgi:hypothetical protein